MPTGFLISGGGGHVLSKLIAHDENIFFLPSISSVIKSSKDFDKVAHCTITDGVVEYYKTHIGAALTSKSLAKVGIFSQYITKLVRSDQLKV